MYIFTSFHELQNTAIYWDGPACVLVQNPWIVERVKVTPEKFVKVEHIW